MKIIGCLLVVGILLSYAPVFHMDGCPEGNHLGTMKMDCGSPFHCPMIVDIVGSNISDLPLNGLLVPTRMPRLKDGLASPIFRPPESLFPEITGKNNKAGDLGTRIADLISKNLLSQSGIQTFSNRDTSKSA